MITTHKFSQKTSHTEIEEKIVKTNNKITRQINILSEEIQIKYVISEEKQLESNNNKIEEAKTTR